MYGVLQNYLISSPIMGGSLILILFPLLQFQPSNSTVTIVD